MLADFNNSFTVGTRNYFCCNLIAVTYYLPVCYLMTSVWRHLPLKLFSFCVEKHRTSFLQTCGLQTVQISIQLTMRSGLWCSVVFTRRKFTPSTNCQSSVVCAMNHAAYISVKKYESGLQLTVNNTWQHNCLESTMTIDNISSLALVSNITC